ncbi:MAG: AAA family ATPase [Verrucomicrobia bacterium]|nr:AAA family ATPase [Verrucomicrobiota bacterium]MCH8510363.1 AAA family ATPase [Kiritimatiellia bacterium]
MKSQWELLEETVEVCNGRIQCKMESPFFFKLSQRARTRLLESGHRHLLAQVLVSTHLCAYEDLAAKSEVLTHPLSEQDVRMHFDPNTETFKIAIPTSLVARLSQEACKAHRRPFLLDRHLRKPTLNQHPGQPVPPASSATSGKKETQKEADSGVVALAHFSNWFQALPVLSPAEMERRLTELGYTGQKEARRAACMAAYRHLSRFRAYYLDDVPVEKLPPKPNLLLFGPTGTGKTHLVNLLFEEILGLPAVIIDMTGFTETGYVGKSVPQILEQLLEAAENNLYRAGVGIVCLDEFDKIASMSSINTYGGSGSSKDVSGYGVQRELLKMIEGSLCDMRGSGANRKGISMHTRFVSFVASGAFSGLSSLASSRKAEQKKPLGFHGGRSSAAATPPITELLGQYGFLPELLGRFNQIARLRPLNREQLTHILRNNILHSYYLECQREEIELKVDPEVLHHWVCLAQRRKFGVRGLHALISRELETHLFHAFHQQRGSILTLFVKDGRVQGRLCSTNRILNYEDVDEDEEVTCL